jgi:hypothetical protein
MWRRFRPSEPELSDYHPTLVDHDFFDRRDDHNIDAFKHDDVEFFRTDIRSAKSHRRLHRSTASDAS